MLWEHRLHVLARVPTRGGHNRNAKRNRAHASHSTKNGGADDLDIVVAYIAVEIERHLERVLTLVAWPRLNSVQINFEVLKRLEELAKRTCAWRQGQTLREATSCVLCPCTFSSATEERDGLPTQGRRQNLEHVSGDAGCTRAPGERGGREAADQARSGFPRAAQSVADPRLPAAALASESTAPCPAPWQIVRCREISMKVRALHQRRLRRRTQANARPTVAQNAAPAGERPSRLLQLVQGVDFLTVFEGMTLLHRNDFTTQK